MSDRDTSNELGIVSYVLGRTVAATDFITIFGINKLGVLREA